MPRSLGPNIGRTDRFVRGFPLLLLALLLSGLFPACREGKDMAGELALYDYRQTRDVVRRVKEAADLIHAKGTTAFETIRETPRYAGQDFYIYVYDLDGKNLFHGGDRRLEGQDLSNVTDINGRKTLIMAYDAAADPDNPHGWIHYYWEQPGRFYAVRKSSCHFITTMPDGRKVLVGGGLTDPPVERVFMKFGVDAAARHITKNGEKALEDVRNPVGPYSYLDRSIFVLDMDGNAIVDPVFLADTDYNYKDRTDAVGRHCIRDVLDKLAEQDSAWVVIQTRNRTSKNMLKRAIYAKKAMLNGKPVLVGGVVELPKPAWSN
ncbi:MAG: cache domain-containing protein [Thermodesulfobacteriota bacterium]